MLNIKPKWKQIKFQMTKIDKPNWSTTKKSDISNNHIYIYPQVLGFKYDLEIALSNYKYNEEDIIKWLQTRTRCFLRFYLLSFS